MEKAPVFPKVADGPQDVRAYWTTAEDALKIRVAHWPSPHVAKGTIFIFQGRTENIEKYGKAVAEFQNVGYDAFALDWRGQGLSDRLTDDRMLGHVGRYADYQKDVTAFLQAAQDLDLPKPWFLFGHSLGACDVPGCRETVLPEESGYLCVPRNSDSLAAACLRVAEATSTERARMGARSRQLAEEKFDVMLVIQAYLEALKEVLPELTIERREA